MKSNGIPSERASYSALSIYRGHLSSYNSRKTPYRSPVRARYEVSFVSANLTEVLSLQLLCCVHYSILFNRDMSSVSSFFKHDIWQMSFSNAFSEILDVKY